MLIRLAPLLYSVKSLENWINVTIDSDYNVNNKSLDKQWKYAEGGE